MIRLQDNVPEPYVDQSRDFQLMLRLYDCVINGVKFDIDTIESTTDTSVASSIILPLLQTKLGFFSEKHITDEELRYVLEAFPIIMKNKGSLLAIKQAVWVYLKLKHMKTTVTVEITSKNDADEPCAVKIWLRTSFTDITPLQEMLKYVIPTGYTLQFYFYNDITNRDEYGNVKDPMHLHNKAKVIYITDSINSAMRDSGYEDDTENRIIGAVDTTEIIDKNSSDGVYATEYEDTGEEDNE